MISDPRLTPLRWPLTRAMEKDIPRDNGHNTNDPRRAMIVGKAVVLSGVRSIAERMHVLFGMIVGLTTEFRIYTAGLFAIVCL